MLGFSLSKLLLTVAVVAGVWWLWRKLVVRATIAAYRTARPERDAQLSRAAKAAAQAQSRIEELVACQVCGTYVAATGVRACDRMDCPY